MISIFYKALQATNTHVAEYIDDSRRYYARLPKVSEHMMPEGDEAITYLEDGSKYEVEMREMSATATKTIEPFEILDIAKVYQMLAELGYQMAVQHQKLFIEKIGGAAEQAGNVFQHKGKITPEDIFNIYQTIELGFFSDGTPHELEMFSSPQMIEEYNQAMEAIKADTELNKRHKLIIAVKKQEWNARENLRKLVG